jgi:hypothetical protein
LPSLPARGKLVGLAAVTVLSAMASLDLLLKVLHIVAVISWMAGMLYLPRLFVYHAGCERKSATSEQFKVMERRLLKGILTPAMVIVWVSGLRLAARQARAGSPPDCAAWIFCRPRAGVRSGSRDPQGDLLSLPQRGSHGRYDPDRLPGGGSAVLSLAASEKSAVERFLEGD